MYNCNTIPSFSNFLELEISLAESKKEIEVLQEKISTISVQKLSPKERIVSICVFNKVLYIIVN